MNNKNKYYLSIVLMLIGFLLLGYLTLSIIVKNFILIIIGLAFIIGGYILKP